jgi:hypothetical protein
VITSEAQKFQHIGVAEPSFRVITMKNKKTAGIDFDTWSALARNDPQTFEKMRLAAIQAAIDGAPEANRERLRRLQWRIDQERRLARTPLAACIRISRMMWRAVLGPNGLRDRVAELQDLLGDNPPGERCGTASGGEVVAFNRSRD